jgi:hypothetical protein
MLTHVVLFWAKADLTAAERADFADGLRTLLSIPKVSAGWVGTPSATERAVVDRSYTFGLTLRFEDLAAHDAYQIDPIHDAFHARCAGYWTKVAVYDVDDLPEDAGPRSR